MVKNAIDLKIMFWLEKGKVRCVDICYTTKTVLFYDEDGNLLMVRRGLTIPQMTEIEKTIKQRRFAKEKITYYFGGN